MSDPQQPEPALDPLLAVAANMQQINPPGPSMLNLDELRELVRAHYLVEELEDCLKRAKAHEALLEARADEQLSSNGVKTMPVSVDQSRLRVVELAPGRCLVSWDFPGIERDDMEHAHSNNILCDAIQVGLAASLGNEDELPGRHHLRPMNVTVAHVLNLARLESVPQEAACDALIRAGYPDLVRPAYNAVSASSAARELLNQLEDCEADEQALRHDGDAVTDATATKETLLKRLATLRTAFDLKTRTDVRVTRAGNKESSSSRAGRAARRLT
jgi:hypothetical protein